MSDKKFIEFAVAVAMINIIICIILIIVGAIKFSIGGTLVLIMAGVMLLVTTTKKDKSE